MSIKNKRIGRVAVVLTALVAVFCFTSAVAAQNTGGVKGKVRTVRGSGVAGATVTARQKGVNVKSVKADAKGTFVLDGLQAGRYNLIFDAPGYSSGVLYNVEIEKKKVADLSERLILSADQGTQVIVKGSVFFKEGTSVAGAKVEIERVNGDGSTKRLGTGYTSESGEFTWRQPRGAAKLRVTATSKGVSSSKIVEVDEPAIYRFAITLELSRSEK